MSRTIVSFHAHPDDEALWTGGTLAAAAAAGHRTVLVVATDGAAGLADAPRGDDLARRRRRELEASAAALGVARVVMLGHRDSGSGRASADGFARVPVDVPVRQLLRVVEEEAPDVLTSYDAAGGYGHPDHRRVHGVARAAARWAGPDAPRLLEATVDRDRVLPVARLLSCVGKVLPVPEIPDLRSCFTPHEEITHRLDVRAHLRAKVEAIAAHASQRTGGPRTAALLLALPRPLQRHVLGTEWFVQVGGPGRSGGVQATSRSLWA